MCLQRNPGNTRPLLTSGTREKHDVLKLESEDLPPWFFWLSPPTAVGGAGHSQWTDGHSHLGNQPQKERNRKV